MENDTGAGSRYLLDLLETGASLEQVVAAMERMEKHYDSLACQLTQMVAYYTSIERRIAHIEKQLFAEWQEKMHPRRAGALPYPQKKAPHDE